MKPVSLEVTMMKRIGELNKEVAALKAKVKRMAMDSLHDINHIADLKAEVERLTKQNALATPRHLIASQDIKTLREQIEELKLENSQYEEHHKYGQNVITSLREEVERLTKENEMLTHKVRYWQIEAECDHGRWLRCLEDLEHLRRLK